MSVVVEPAALEKALGDLLTRRLGASFRIEGLTRLSGGASRESWSFDALGPEGERRGLVLRRDFPELSKGAAHAAGVLLLESLDRRGEFELYRTLFEAGIPVPRPVAPLDEASGLGEGFLMERMEGETLPQRILRDPAYERARALLTEQVADAAARLHALPRQALPPLPEQPAATQMASCRLLLDRDPTPRPVFELAYRWLREHRPEDPPSLALVHGDFRNGNFLVGPEGLRAILDWEYAHLGDPMEDLAFLCLRPWRFGVVEKEAGGFGTRKELFEAYARARGQDVDAQRVHFWEVLGALKWGVLCAARGAAHVAGLQRSLEAAAIGRRVAETEYDLLELLEDPHAV